MSLHLHLRRWSYHCNVISLLVKLRIKSVPSGCSNQINYFKKLVLRYSCFPNKLIIIINVILDYVERMSYRSVRVEGKSVKHHYLVICSGNISVLLRKGGRILGVVILIFHKSFQNVSYVFVATVQWGPSVWKNRTYGNSWLICFWLTITSRHRKVSRFYMII